MQNINTNLAKKNSLITTMIVILICSTLVLFSFFLVGQKSPTYSKTDIAKKELTNSYGEIVKKIISDFEKEWTSLEMHKNPNNYLGDLVTGPLYDYYQRHPLYQNQSSFLISSELEITEIKVLEFDDNVFKAIACINWGIDQVDTNGSLLKKYGTSKIQKFYAFFREKGKWKLGLFIDITNPHAGQQEWEYLPADLKNYVGKFTPFTYMKCLSN
jgi:hypothetical protein